MNKPHVNEERKKTVKILFGDIYMSLIYIHGYFS